MKRVAKELTVYQLPHISPGVRILSLTKEHSPYIILLFLTIPRLIPPSLRPRNTVNRPFEKYIIMSIIAEHQPSSPPSSILATPCSSPTFGPSSPVIQLHNETEPSDEEQEFNDPFLAVSYPSKETEKTVSEPTTLSGDIVTRKVIPLFTLESPTFILDAVDSDFDDEDYGVEETSQWMYAISSGEGWSLGGSEEDYFSLARALPHPFNRSLTPA